MTHTLPPGWEEKTLGEVCEIERGGSPRPIKSYLTTAPTGLNWIKIGDTSPNSKYIYSVKEKIRPEGLAKSRWVQEGDFLLSNSMSFGRPYILKTNGCIHDGWLVLKQYQSNLQCDFLYYLLSSPFVQKQFQQSAQGSTVRNLNTQRVAKIIIPIPPLLEQKRIVGKLNKIFAAIDKAKENTKKNLENAVSVFEGYLNKQFKETTKNWIETTFAEEITIKSGDFLPAKSMNKNGKYEVYGGNGITGYHNIANYNGENVIIGRVGEKCGNVHYTDKDIWVTDNAFIVMHTEHDFDKKFLCSLLQMAKLRRYAAKSTHPVISGKSLRSVKLCFPISLSEQQEIVKELERLQIQTQKLEQIYTKKLVNLEELKQSVLQQAFSGKL